MPRSAAVLVAVLLSGCGAPHLPPVTTEMGDVLAERRAMGTIDRSDLSLQEARDAPSLVEAAYAINNNQGLPAQITEVAQFNQPNASGAAGPIGASLYRPKLANNTPVIVFFPGGTWATRRDAADDEIARQLAIRTGWIVVVPRLRLAPQASFPAIHDDALAAYQWARGSMRSWGGDPTRVVLAGEGPGANLALSTALLARDRGLPLPNELLLVTPWAGTATDTSTMQAYRRSEPLSRATVRWAQDLYVPRDRANPRIDLARRTDLAGLPPTLLVLAEVDPFRSSADALASNLQAVGNRVDIRAYGGVTQDFFGLGAYVPRAAEAEADVAAALLARFPEPPPAAPRPSSSRSRARR